jgi:hypothetical protein
VIRLLETLGGARRAWRGPILRLLDGGDVRYVVGMSGEGIVSAIGNDPCQPGGVDGSVEVLELMAGGTNRPLTESKAAHAVLDRLDEKRTEWRNHPAGEAPFVDGLRQASAFVSAARTGDLESRRLWAIDAAARLLSSVELIDEELAR